VLDDSLAPVPPGAAGELFVAGTGVGRGYWNRPDLTAKQFVPDPWSGVPGARLYRTGDRVRHLRGGSLEYLGRIDEQVKLRGYRIEPGEIESVLCESPAVRESAVLVREDAPGDHRLVAYFVGRAGSETPTTELRDFLRTRLPDYMIPSAFVRLDALPLTPNGKVDRRALPAPGGARPEQDEVFVAARTSTEMVIAAAFGRALGVDRVGLHDSFFRLGGHSLLATQVVSRLGDSLRTQVPLRLLFEAPSVAELAAALLADPERGKDLAEIADVLVEVARLSDEEAGGMLAREAGGAA
jgi:hypothetical protein